MIDKCGQPIKRRLSRVFQPYGKNDDFYGSSSDALPKRLMQATEERPCADDDCMVHIPGVIWAIPSCVHGGLDLLTT